MLCNNCQHKNQQKANFCGKCGSKINSPVATFDYNKYVKRISFLFFVMLAYVTIINFLDFGTNYIYTLLIDILFGIIILIFYLIDPISINKLLRLKRLKKHIIIKIMMIAPMVAALVSLIANFLNQSVFDRSQTTYYEHFIDSPAPILFTIISIGLFPAIFEEVAFRGILFNDLVKITRVKSSIIISAILFTILHLSLISILWIFPIGLLFGYFRAKYRTMWYGIIGHFVYNISIVAIELINF